MNFNELAARTAINLFHIDSTNRAAITFIFKAQGPVYGVSFISNACLHVCLALFVQGKLFLVLVTGKKQNKPGKVQNMMTYFLIIEIKPCMNIKVVTLISEREI